jgi:hypothetical protein
MGQGDYKLSSVGAAKFTTVNGNPYAPRQISSLNGNGTNGSTIGAYQTGFAQVIGDLIVRQDGLGDTTNLDEALTSVTLGAGHIIEIQQWTTDFSSHNPATTAGDMQMSLICTDSKGNATINVTSDVTWGPQFAKVANGYIKNINFVGTGNTGDNGTTTTIHPVTFIWVMAAPYDIENCSFKNYNGYALGTFFDQPTLTNSKVTFKGNYFFNCAQGIQCDIYSSTGTGVPVTTIDHNTIDCRTTTDTAATAIIVQNNWFDTSKGNDRNGAKIIVSNNILKVTPGGQGVFVANGLTNVNGLQSAFSYDDWIYPAGTVRQWWGSGPLALGGTELDNVDPLFTDEANGDLSVLVNSPMVGAGQSLGTGLGRSTIGAFQRVAPPTPNAAKSWTFFN